MEQFRGRRYLKVKLKSLAEEARIIRKEENKAKKEARRVGDVRVNWSMLREELHNHRVVIVREAARHTHLAYGFLRGRAYQQMEAKCKTPPLWDSIKKMVLKYGGDGDAFEEWRKA